MITVVSEERAKSIFTLHVGSTLLGNVCRLQYSQSVCLHRASMIIKHFIIQLVHNI